MTVATAWRGLLPFELYPEDDRPPGPPPADRLQWEGASPEQLAFMREVYRRHVASASAQRTFVPSVPGADLGLVEHGQRLRRPAAERCVAMLAQARADLATEQAAGSEAATKVKEFGARSGYRSVETQFASWERTFRTKYYPNTRAERERLDGGAHGPAAVVWMARYVGRRLGAPGFSRHNDGLAMDFYTHEGKLRLGPDTGRTSISRWRGSWLFSWLSRRAAEYHFHQNTSIEEPWHWEFRAPAAATVGEGMVTAGRLEVASAPPLASHRGTPPDLILRWNDMPAVPDTVDLVLHLHGFSNKGGAMRLDLQKESDSGLDFVDPAAPGAGTGRTRPTLGILPRGSHLGGSKYDFPALQSLRGLDALVDFSLAQFAAAIGAGTVRRGRFILTAHSGGGKSLVAILGFADPDEVHVFDALYWSPAGLITWARRRIARDAAAGGGSAPSDGGACRVLFLEPPPGKDWTKPGSLAVHRAMRNALRAAGTAGPPLQPRYRVERTREQHGDIPRRYGWRLLADAGAALARTQSP